MKILTSQGCLGKNKSMTSSLNTLLSNSNEGVEMSSIFFFFLKVFYFKNYYFHTFESKNTDKIKILIKIMFT